MRPEPPWAHASAAPSHPPLREDARTGVCVIGGGATGLLTALLLARQRVPVAVLEQSVVGGGESGRSTAHLTTALDRGYAALERRRGAAAARLAAESHSAAIELIAGLCAAHGIACDLETVDAFIVGGAGEERELDAEIASARRAGLIEVERLQRVPGDAFGSASCVRFPRQAQLDPARFLAGLAHALERLGGRIYGGTRVVGVDGTPVRVSTAAGPVVTADAAVIAAHAPPAELAYAAPGVPHQTYVVAAQIPPRSVHRALYWEWSRPYHYVRLFGAPRPGSAEQPELLVVGGEDHPAAKTADAEPRYGRLEAWMRERFPMAQAVSHRWSGRILEPRDGLASVGVHPRRPGVFFASGFSGNGMTHAAVAAMILSDLALGRPNPWTTLYEPSRVRGRFSRLAREGLRLARGVSSWWPHPLSMRQAKPGG